MGARTCYDAIRNSAGSLARNVRNVLGMLADKEFQHFAWFESGSDSVFPG
jgi:hypothetical protein